jgi:hypothetical protein
MMVCFKVDGYYDAEAFLVEVVVNRIAATRALRLGEIHTASVGVGRFPCVCALRVRYYEVAGIERSWKSLQNGRK